MIVQPRLSDSMSREAIGKGKTNASKDRERKRKEGKRIKTAAKGEEKERT